MTYLKAHAARFKGHRLYAIAGLLVLAGLLARGAARTPDRGRRLDRWDALRPGPAPRGARLSGGRGTRVVDRAVDRGKSPYVFPDDRRDGPWINISLGHGNDSIKLRRQFGRAAADAGLPGRVTPFDLCRFCNRRDGRVELGPEWHKTRSPGRSRTRAIRRRIRPRANPRRHEAGEPVRLVKDFRPAVEITDPRDPVIRPGQGQGSPDPEPVQGRQAALPGLSRRADRAADGRTVRRQGLAGGHQGPQGWRPGLAEGDRPAAARERPSGTPTCGGSSPSDSA